MVGSEGNWARPKVPLPPKDVVKKCLNKGESGKCWAITPLEGGDTCKGKFGERRNGGVKSEV